jgi:hypothetical protein
MMWPSPEGTGEREISALIAGSVGKPGRTK